MLEGLQATPPKSVIVSTGTASGKTECFLVTYLGRPYQGMAGFFQEAARGVRALFLYPLNALINSQEERLSAWTAGFEGDIRYCLYNGATPENYKSDDTKRKPEQVLSREALRLRHRLFLLPMQPCSNTCSFDAWINRSLRRRKVS